MLSVNGIQTLIQSVQRKLDLLFQRILFRMFPLFEKYLKPQVKNNELVNSAAYHSCPSRLASGKHPYFFKLLRVLSLSRMLVEFSDLYISQCVGKLFSIYGVYIRKLTESRHFYSCPSYPLKTPGTIF